MPKAEKKLNMKKLKPPQQKLCAAILRERFPSPPAALTGQEQSHFESCYREAYEIAIATPPDQCAQVLADWLFRTAQGARRDYGVNYSEK